MNEECILINGKKGIYKDINACSHSQRLSKENRQSEIETCSQSGNMSVVCCPESSKKFKDVLCENRAPDVRRLRLIEGSEFPYFAAIGYTNEIREDTIEYLCGGALLADDVVISVAHCFRGRLNPRVVKLGVVSIQI